MNTRTTLALAAALAPAAAQGRDRTAAIDGVAMEELSYLATDKPCTRDWCAENLAHTRALRDAGKFVLAVDYAVRPDHIRAACRHYRAERFAGTVTVRDVDQIPAPCD